MNERRIAMMQIIDSRKKFTARELAERFGVSVRTIQRDLDYLQQIGFPLYTEQGPHGGYRALPNRILPPLQLNQTEALGLFLSLQVLEKISDFPFSAVRSHLSANITPACRRIFKTPSTGCTTISPFTNSNGWRNTRPIRPKFCRLLWSKELWLFNINPNPAADKYMLSPWDSIMRTGSGICPRFIKKGSCFTEQTASKTHLSQKR